MSAAAPVSATRPLASALAWAAIAALGLALVAIAVGPHRVGDYYTETDLYGGYAPGARLIAHGRFDASRYGVTGPLFDVALALVGTLTRDLFVAGKAISVASMLAALALWFTLLRARAGAAAAAWTTALLAANASVLRYGSSATTDALAFALEAAALHLALVRSGRRRALLAGACLALATLTRYTAVALLPALLIAPALEPSEPGRSRARRALLLLAGFVLVASPFVALSLARGHVPGELLFHDVAYDAYASAQGRTLADYQVLSQPGLHSLGQALAHDPVTLARRELANLYGHAVADARDLLGWPAAAAAALGLALLVARRRSRVAGPLAIAGLALYLSLVPAPAAARYSLALAPFYLALAGLALGSPRLPLAKLRRVAGPFAGAALVAVALVAGASAERESLALLPVETLEVAPALRAVPAAERSVMALKPHLAWIADARFVPMPQFSSLAALAAACRGSGARYLYVSWIETNNRPAIWYLLDPASPVPGLRAVASTPRPGAVLYRIEPGFGAPPSWMASDTARAASAARFLARMPAPLAGRAELTLAAWARGENRFAETREHAEAALAADPGQPFAWRLLGDARLAGGDRPGAIASFGRALALSPGDVETRVALGWMQLAEGRDGDAAATWAPAVDATTDRPTLERMAALYRARGEAALAARADAARARAGR